MKIALDYITANTMDADIYENEKLSIKNLLFTRAIPNYKLPSSAEGHTIYACTDCGDKFLIKSSYEYHINRKSLKVTYFCRYCNLTKIFYNRCGLLSHIRSHAFKTATINISDLKIEPLPLSFYNPEILKQFGIATESTPESSSPNHDDSEVQNETNTIICFDCKKNIFCSGILYQDRAKHYTQYNNIVYSCPICMLTLTTKCALQAHLRIHTNEPPYYCPDCGTFLTNNAVVYPYTHDCESFKMMRATAKRRCSANNCNTLFHPSESIKHLRSKHIKPIFKCPTCSVACYKFENMQKHLISFHMKKSKQIEAKSFKHIDFLQCEMCPGRLVMPSQIERHLKSHEINYINSVYPCWTCGATFKLAKSLLVHQEANHPQIYKEKIFGKDANVAHSKISEKGIFHAYNKLKKCNGNRCRTDLLSKCKTDATKKIVCNLCQVKITQDWNVIKKHYAIHHKEHVCLDARIMLKKISMNKKKIAINSTNRQKKINHQENTPYNVKNDDVAPETHQNDTVSLNGDKFACSKCSTVCDNKQNLEKHFVNHRDPFMAYQCVECGESFITKPTFSKHLLLEHGLYDVNDYILQKKCYYEESLQTPSNYEQNEPVKENQCSICREQFSNSTDFEKHFRVHGMAFLMKNSNKPISPEKL